MAAGGQQVDSHSLSLYSTVDGRVLSPCAHGHRPVPPAWSTGPGPLQLWSLPPRPPALSPGGLLPPLAFRLSSPDPTPWATSPRCGPCAKGTLVGKGGGQVSLSRGSAARGQGSLASCGLAGDEERAALT
jgi:hypothetical protein